MKTSIRPILQKVNIQSSTSGGTVTARSTARQPRSVVVKVPGPQGAAGTANIGTVTVLNPNQNPTITASGTEINRIYNYGIPRAPSVGIGTVSPLDPDQPPTVTATTTDGDVVYNFGIPKAASFTVSDTVVFPNVDPSVFSTVTNGDVALDFALPRAAQISVGTTTVVDPDQNPSSSITPDANGDAVLDFSLPRASTFSVGTVTSVQNTEPAAIENIGINGDVVLDFAIPVGANGIEVGFNAPADTNVLWLDEGSIGTGYSVYMENILDVDYGSASEPDLNSVLVWDGYNWVPDSRVAVLG